MPDAPLRNMELLQWLLDRHDRWRASIVTRSAVVVSVAALLLASQVAFISISDAWTVLSLVPPFFVFSIASILLLLLATLVALHGLANVWRHGRERNYGRGQMDRFVFHPSDVVGHRTTDGQPTFEQFKMRCNDARQEYLVDAAQAELWAVLHMHHERYQHLRTTIKLMAAAMIPYAIAVAIVAWG